MSLALGITLAFITMLCWGFGDFLIQKSARKFGDVETLFLISFFGAIVLLPFIYSQLSSIFTLSNLIILSITSVVMLIGALLDFEALKKGKLAIVEPIYALEIPVAGLLAFFIIKETLTIQQLILLCSLLFGLVLVSLKSHHFSKHIWLEKGVFLVFLGAVFMGASNFLVGLSSRQTNPLMINWFMSIFMTIICLGIMVYNKKTKSFLKDCKNNKKILFNMCLLDQSAWLAFAFAMTLAPISIAVALSESYIIVAMLLGVYINKEFLRKNQKIGLVIAIVSAIALASITI